MAVPRAVRVRRRDDEFVEAMRAGIRLAASRGVTAVHDKDGWLGALALLAAAEATRARSRCACGSRCRTSSLDELEALGFARRARRRLAARSAT